MAPTEYGCVVTIFCLVAEDNPSTQDLNSPIIHPIPVDISLPTTAMIIILKAVDITIQIHLRVILCLIHQLVISPDTGKAIIQQRTTIRANLNNLIYWKLQNFTMTKRSSAYHVVIHLPKVSLYPLTNSVMHTTPSSLIQFYIGQRMSIEWHYALICILQQV